MLAICSLVPLPFLNTEAKDVKKRCQEYTEELYSKDLNDPDNHDCVITHLEPDILQCGQVGRRKHYYEQS